MIELLYRVVNLSQRGGVVLMVLEEVRTVPPEEITRARLEAEKDPENDIVDEGKQFGKVDLDPPPKDPVEKMLWAAKRQIPGLEEAFKDAFKGSPMGPGGRMMVVRGPSPVQLINIVEIHVTTEQYVELGSPPLLSTIQLTLSV